MAAFTVDECFQKMTPKEVAKAEMSVDCFFCSESVQHATHKTFKEFRHSSGQLDNSIEGLEQDTSDSTEHFREVQDKPFYYCNDLNRPVSKTVDHRIIKDHSWNLSPRRPCDGKEDSLWVHANLVMSTKDNNKKCQLCQSELQNNSPVSTEDKVQSWLQGMEVIRQDRYLARFMQSVNRNNHQTQFQVDHCVDCSKPSSTSRYTHTRKIRCAHARSLSEVPEDVVSQDKAHFESLYDTHHTPCQHRIDANEIFQPVAPSGSDIDDLIHTPCRFYLSDKSLYQRRNDNINIIQLSPIKRIRTNSQCCSSLTPDLSLTSDDSKHDTCQMESYYVDLTENSSKCSPVNSQSVKENICENIDSDATAFMHCPLVTKGVISRAITTSKQRTLAKKLKQVYKHLHRIGHSAIKMKTLAVL